MTSEWPWAQAFDAEGIYLATATVGLPPRVTSDALADVHERWRRGRLAGPDFDDVVTEARHRFADLVHVDPSCVAVGHQVAPLVALVAASLPDGAEVLVAQGEFTSISFPFLAQAHRGIRVCEVPLAELAEHVGDDTSLVAVAAVQSADGAVADLAAIEAAARGRGTEILVDLTQATGWLHIDASRYAYTVCGTYKWLLSPRGTAFLTVRRDLFASLVPAQANWFAGVSSWDSIYGLPLRLAEDARRFDVSPAWFGWVGARASLEFLGAVGIEALQRHALQCATAFAEAAEIAVRDSAIVSVAADDAVAELMAGADARASVRAGRLRLAFHVNNTVEECARLGRLLRGHVAD